MRKLLVTPTVPSVGPAGRGSVGEVVCSELLQAEEPGRPR